VVSKAIGNRSHHWSLVTREKVRPGQLVEIGLPEKKLLQFASIVYLLPIVLLMFGGFLGEFLAGSAEGEGPVILLAFLAMAAGIWLARKLSDKMQLASEQAVTLIRVLGEPVDIG
jgi:sigma-E factor negative regulatory protein RseC